jgi:outer membrane cobalamin receptor
MKYLEHSLLFNAYQVDESYLGKLPRFSFGAGKNHLATGYLFNYSFAHNFSDKFKINTNATFDWNLRDLASSSDDNARAINEGYRLFANLYLTYLPTKTWQFEVGSDYDFRHNIRVDDYLVHEDKVIFHNNSRDRKLSEYSFYGQLQYSNYGFNIVAGARTTQNELFGNNVSYRITTLYKFNKNNSLKVIYGFSFRAPSFFELYFVTPFFTVFGNPNLQPERAKSGEVVYLTSFNHFFIQILTYHGTYYDKIHREIKNIEYNNVLYKNKNVYVNGKTFKSYGVEFEMKYRNPSLFNSFIYYSYTIGDKGDEVNNNYNFKYVPLHTSSIGISKKINNFEISTVINYWSKTNGPISEIAPQIFADVSLSFFQIYNGFKIKHALSVRNLTDEKIMVPEYVRRTTINEISFGFGRRIMYNINISI